MISKLNTYTFLIIATIASFFVMAAFKTPSVGVIQESGWFGYIDDTAFIFILIALPFFLILLAYSIAGNSLKKTTKDSLRHLSASQKALLYLTHPLLIGLLLHLKFKHLLNKISQSRGVKYTLLLAIVLGTIYFFQYTSFLSWKPYSGLANTIRNSIVIGSLMLAFNYLKESAFIKKCAFWKAEFYKFSTLFFGAIVMLNVANVIAITIDNNTFTTITKVPFIDSPELIIVGLALAFAIANLFNNITQSYLNIHYKA